MKPLIRLLACSALVLGQVASMATSASARDFDLAIDVYNRAEFTRGRMHLVRDGVPVIQDFRRLHYRIEVVNQGLEASRRARVRVNGYDIEEGHFAQREIATVPHLAPGEGFVVDFDFDIAETFGRIPGTVDGATLFYLTTMRLRELDDFSSRNNWEYFVIDDDYFQPDLEAEVIAVDTGYPATASIRVRNQGPVATGGPSSMGLFVDADERARWEVDSLAPGDAVEFEAEAGVIYPPFDVVCHDFEAVADVDDAVLESTESNNADHREVCQGISLGF